MRLDLFLKASRLVPRRTIAQQLCDAGLVTLNSRQGKSGSAVKVADQITIRRGKRVLTVQVLKVPSLTQVPKKETTNLYQIVREEVIEDF